MALKENHKIHGWAGHLYAYDLWDDYEYNHGNYDDVVNTISKYKLNDYVTLRKGSLEDAHNDFKGGRPICLLHIDISNDGNVFDYVMDLWSDVLSYGSLIMFEGGSAERDNIHWMKTNGKRSIRDAISNNKLANSIYIYCTYEKFPSITLLLNRS
jgi:hypothetical protein